ncbi:MAG: thiosulfate sulfurtransferase [Candidatus Cloacimonetes bacterium]|nr:thiosulfate sulfurtransferase [Candidatus Cloacimonadota bacterium]
MSEVREKYHLIETEELQGKLEDENLIILDVRSIDAYNGWKLQREIRGGHIKRAKSLPVKWTKYIDWIEVVRHKHIHPENEIVIYGYTQDDMLKVAEMFRATGYKKISLYYDFISEWVPKEKYPMEKLKRYRHLVPAEWVKSLTMGEPTSEYDNNQFVIVHAHYRNRNAYLSGHIRGAIDMDTLALEAPETWNRRTPEELRKALELHGITADTTVILYGKYMSPDNNDEFPGSAAGDIGAMRCALIMLYSGVKDVRILNGGFQSWIDAGFEISTIDEPKKPVISFGINIPAIPELIVDTAEAKEMLASPKSELVCVRSYPEYIGDVSGYNYIEAKGRIPGAIFANCGSDAYHMENYRNVDHTAREYHEIEAIWSKLGITSDKRLAFYCGTGWRGSEAFINAWLLGWQNIAVYDGGWFEWSKDKTNPYETGIPKE